MDSFRGGRPFRGRGGGMGRGRGRGMEGRGRGRGDGRGRDVWGRDGRGREERGRGRGRGRFERTFDGPNRRSSYDGDQRSHRESPRDYHQERRASSFTEAPKPKRTRAASFGSEGEVLTDAEISPVPSPVPPRSEPMTDYSSLADTPMSSEQRHPASSQSSLHQNSREPSRNNTQTQQSFYQGDRPVPGGEHNRAAQPRQGPHPVAANRTAASYNRPFNRGNYPNRNENHGCMLHNAPQAGVGARPFQRSEGNLYSSGPQGSAPPPERRTSAFNRSFDYSGNASFQGSVPFGERGSGLPPPHARDNYPSNRQVSESSANTPFRDRNDVPRPHALDRSRSLPIRGRGTGRFSPMPPQRRQASTPGHFQVDQRSPFPGRGPFPGMQSRSQDINNASFRSPSVDVGGRNTDPRQTQPESVRSASSGPYHTAIYRGGNVPGGEPALDAFGRRVSVPGNVGATSAFVPRDFPGRGLPPGRGPRGSGFEGQRGGRFNVYGRGGDKDRGGPARGRSGRHVPGGRVGVPYAAGIHASPQHYGGTQDHTMRNNDFIRHQNNQSRSAATPLTGVASISTKPASQKDPELPQTVKPPEPLSPPKPRVETPPPGEASGYVKALCRLQEVQAHLDFCYAKHVKISLDARLASAARAKVESLPVGLEALIEELSTSKGATE